MYEIGCRDVGKAKPTTVEGVYNRIQIGQQYRIWYYGFWRDEFYYIDRIKPLDGISDSVKLGRRRQSERLVQPLVGQ